MPDEQREQSVARALRAARRRHYLREGDWVDSLYKAYVTAIVAGLGLFYLSLALGGDRVDASVLSTITERGPAVLGLGVAVVVGLGLRSGARGGPLAPEPADVTYLLLAPIPRGPVLRSAALRQLRGVVLIPAIGGAVAGSIAAGKLGGSRAEWIVVGGAFGALTAVAAWGAALVASGSRLDRRRANAIAALLVAWSVIDIVAGTATAPTAQVGRVALLPLVGSWLAVVGIGLVLALAAEGLVLVANVSLEPLRRRAQLVNEIRFAATLQDMRSVIVLHRELAQELPRSQPWWSPRAAAGGSGSPCWRRDWRGFARWPSARVARVVAFSAVAGLACVGVWNGTDAFVVVAGLAVFFAAIDAVEGLAQEADHPDRSNLLPLRGGDLILAHVLAPACVLLIVGLVSVAVFGGISGTRTALVVALVALVPVALLGAVAAATQVAIGAPPPTLFLDYGFPELMIPLLILRQTIAPLLVTAAFVPVAVAHDAWTSGASPSGAAVTAAVLPLSLAAVASVWLRSRRSVSG
ncbi:MAG: hypothetical protein ACHQDE_05215 [Acidimicrobiia bacterium]